MGEPVFLTRNGRGCYALIDIKEYEKTQAKIKLMSKLAEVETAIKDGNEWLTVEEVEKSLEV